MQKIFISIFWALYLSFNTCLRLWAASCNNWYCKYQGTVVPPQVAKLLSLYVKNCGFEKSKASRGRIHKSWSFCSFLWTFFQSGTVIWRLQNWWNSSVLLRLQIRERLCMRSIDLYREFQSGFSQVEDSSCHSVMTFLSQRARRALVGIFRFQ